MAKSKWFEETETRIGKAKKKAETYKSSVEKASQVVKEAEEAITKYELVRADADTAREEAERIINYIKQEIGSANEDAAKGAEAYREHLKSKTDRKKAAAVAAPSDNTTDMPPYVTEQPDKAAEPKRPAKVPSITELAASATEGAEAPAEVPAEKPVYTREMLDKAKEAAVNVKACTDKIIKAQQEEAEKEEVCALEKSAMIRTYLNEHKNDADAQEASSAVQAAFDRVDFKGIIAAYNGFDAKVKQKDKDYEEYLGLETKIYRKLTTLNEIEAKIPQHEGKDYKIDNPEVSLREVKHRVEAAKRRYKEEDYYRFGAEVTEAVEALEKLEKYAEKAAKAEPPEEKKEPAEPEKEPKTFVEPEARKLGAATAVFQTEVNDAANMGIEVPEGVRKLEDKAKECIKNGDYSNAWLAIEGARAQFRPYVKREEERLAAEKESGTLELLYETDNKEYALVCAHLAKAKGISADIVETPDKDGKHYTVNVIYDPQNKDEAAKVKELKKGFKKTTSSLSKFTFTKEEYEELENSAAPIIEALETAGLVIDPGTGVIAKDQYRLKGGVPLAVAEALKESAKKMLSLKKAPKAEKAAAEKPAIETAENYEHFEAYVEDLQDYAAKNNIAHPAPPTWGVFAQDGNYKSAFECLEEEQERLETKIREVVSLKKEFEALEKEAEDIVAPETPGQEAARKKAEEKAEEKRHIVDVAENGEPDHVVYRTDKRSFAEAAITALKKQKINAKLKIDPDQRDSFTVMVPEELAKDKRFKPIEKELNKKTGKMHGLEKEEYDAIMKAEGSRPKQILDSFIADKEVEEPSSMLTHYKLKNASEAVTKYLKVEAKMIKTGAKPDEAEGFQGILTDEARRDLYETTDIKFLEGMERAQRDGLDTGEAQELREKAKELFKKGDYRSAVPQLMEAKKKLDDEIKRGIMGKDPLFKEGAELDEKYAKIKDSIETLGKKLEPPEEKGLEKEEEEKPEEGAVYKFNNATDEKAAILLQQIEDARKEDANSADITAASKAYLTVLAKMAASDLEAAELVLNDAFTYVEQARRAKEQVPEAPKNEERPVEPEKVEAPKKAAMTKVNVPTKVYNYLLSNSESPVEVTSRKIVSQAKKGTLYGYNIEATADEAKTIKDRIKLAEIEMKEAERREKLVKKMDAAYGYHPALPEPAKPEEPEKREGPKEETPAPSEEMNDPSINQVLKEGAELDNEWSGIKGRIDNLGEKMGIPKENSEEEKSEEKEPVAPEKKEEEKPRIAKIRCPKCKDIMEISSPKRPLEIRCSSCNAKLLMRK